MRILSFILIIAFASSLYGQSNFLLKELETPSSDATLNHLEFVDIDNDGDEDLIGISYLNNNFLIYLNQPGGLDSIPLLINANVEDFEIVDWNNDNFPDLVYTDNGQGAAHLALKINLGNLNFEEAVILSEFTSALEIQDINNDGFPDVFDSYNDEIFENNGGSSSVTAKIKNIENGVGDYMDLDGDGDKDFIQIQWNGNDFYNLVLYEAMASYQYVPIDTIIGFSTVNVNLGCNEDIMIKDLNNDGSPEVIIKACWKVFVLEQIGDFEFDFHYAGNSLISNYSFNYPDINVKDIDQNGLEDIVVNRSIFFNDNFTFSKTDLPFTPNHSHRELAIADTDNDNTMELWESYGQSFFGHRMDRYQYLSGTSIAGREKMWNMYPRESDFGALMDVDNDGDFDMVFPSDINLVLSKNNEGIFSESILLNNINAYPSLYEVHPIDYNNDGWMDILVRDDFNDVIRWLRNNQDNTFEDMGVLYTINDFYTIESIGDFNNDNLIDLIISRKTSTNIRVDYLLNNGTTLIKQQEIISTQSGTFGEYAMDFHDFNGDSYQDLIVSFTRDNGARTVNVYENDNGTIFNHSFGENMTINGRWMGLSDMTLDGKMDLCYGKIVNNSTNELVVIPSNGDGSFGVGQVQLFEESLDLKSIMIDANNDGLIDLVNSLFTSFNTGTGLTNGIDLNDNMHLNNITQYLDYDQDGDIDIFSNRSGNGKAFIWENIFIGNSEIQGSVFLDENANGIKDIGEVPVSNLKIGIDGFGSYSYSDDLGDFVFPLGSNTGNFQLTSESIYNKHFTFTTPIPLSVSLSENNPIETVAIGVQVISDTLTFYQNISNQRCNDIGRLWLNYFSLRSGLSDGQIELTLPPNVTYASAASLPPTSINDNILTWDIADIEVIENEGLWLNINNPDFQFAGDSLTFISKMQTWINSDTITILDTISVEVICAFDPNDKTIINIDDFAIGDAYYTTQNQVDYQIRFQNTGTAPALGIILRDNIPVDFDYDSFQLLSSSHPVDISLSRIGLLEATYKNINLPDSTADFAGSMGYLAFRVNLKENVQREKIIQNGARIYFDQNPPIYTNISQFQRVDCNHFLQLEASEGIICGNAIDTATVYDYGVAQNYEWQFNNIAVSTLDTATFYIPGDGLFPLELSTQNSLCSSDTLIQFNIDQSIPQTLGLSFMDTTLCNGFGGVELQTSELCDWSIDGNVFANNTASNFLFLSGIYTLENSIGVCKLTEEVEVSFQDFSFQEEDYFSDIPVNGYVFCHGEYMQFSTTLNPPFYWTYSETGTQEYQGNPVQISTEENSNISSAQVSFVKDTLNCTIGATVDVSFIEDLNFVDNLAQTYFLCDGIDSILINLQTIPVSVDSLQIFQNGNLVISYDSNVPTELNFSQSGDYDIIAHLACHISILSINIKNINDLIPNLLISEDSLYNSSNEIVEWFYSQSINNSFTSISSGSSIIAPSDGYYFFSFEIGNCIQLSDTILVQTVDVNNLIKDDFEMKYSLDSKIITVQGNIPRGTRLEIFNVNGKLIFEDLLQQSQTVPNYPPGIYVAFAWVNNQPIEILRILVFD